MVKNILHIYYIKIKVGNDDCFRFTKVIWILNPHFMQNNLIITNWSRSVKYNLGWVCVCGDDLINNSVNNMRLRLYKHLKAYKKIIIVCI